jgi:tetratricopeptide (TPR) repeat protein
MRSAGSPAGPPPGNKSDKAAGRGPGADANPGLAAEMWERAFLSNYSKAIMFVEPSANLTIPALIRRTRAVGVAMASKADPTRAPAAVAAAAEVLALHPGDTDSQIAVVRALDRAGRKAEADAVHRKAFETYDAVRKAYPDSPAAHNLVAWLCGCDKRDLEVGLTVAKRAVELDPDNAAILDTLSEVYFARKEYDEALKVNARCREIEPWVEHHRKNLERFTAAKNGKPTDGPLEGEED